MSYEFSIGPTQAQAFSSATLNVNNAEEKEENPKTTLTTDKDGDTVEISTEAKDLLEKSQADKSQTAASGNSSESSEADSETSEEEKMIEKIKEQIDKVQQEIEKLKQDPEKNKEQISAKQNELMQLQGQLTQLIKQQAENSGTSVGGGTRAQGFSNSLT